VRRVDLDGGDHSDVSGRYALGDALFVGSGGVADLSVRAGGVEHLEHAVDLPISQRDGQCVVVVVPLPVPRNSSQPPPQRHVVVVHQRLLDLEGQSAAVEHVVVQATTECHDGLATDLYRRAERGRHGPCRLGLQELGERIWDCPAPSRASRRPGAAR
jgi:hypothetical protein